MPNFKIPSFAPGQLQGAVADIADTRPMFAVIGIVTPNHHGPILVSKIGNSDRYGVVLESGQKSYFTVTKTGRVFIDDRAWNTLSAGKQADLVAIGAKKIVDGYSIVP